MVRSEVLQTKGLCGSALIDGRRERSSVICYFTDFGKGILTKTVRKLGSTRGRTSQVLTERVMPLVSLQNLLSAAHLSREAANSVLVEEVAERPDRHFQKFGSSGLVAACRS